MDLSHDSQIRSSMLHMICRVPHGHSNLSLEIGALSPELGGHHILCKAPATACGHPRWHSSVHEGQCRQWELLLVACEALDGQPLAAAQCQHRALPLSARSNL